MKRVFAGLLGYGLALSELPLRRRRLPGNGLSKSAREAHEVRKGGREMMKVVVGMFFALTAVGPAAEAGEVGIVDIQGVSGGVSLTTSGSTLASSGWAEHNQAFPQFCSTNCVHGLAGQHRIYDVASYAIVTETDFGGVGTFQYSGNISTGGAPGRCYRGRLEARAINAQGGTVESNNFGSGQQCIPSPPPPRDDSEGEGDDGDEDGCQTGCYDPNTPIIVDVNGDGYNLTGLDDTVSFDLDSDGKPELLTWTAANGDDAFLAFDRNGNGSIENGSELFGAVTPLSTGEKAQIGYVALADADLPENGGNLDRVINASDKIFEGLRLWTDRNHDGLSEPSELQTMDEIGILRFEYDYTLSQKKDRNGNRFVYKGQAWSRNRAVRARSFKREYEPAPPGNRTGFRFPIYDVILQRR